MAQHCPKQRRYWSWRDHLESHHSLPTKQTDGISSTILSVVHESDHITTIPLDFMVPHSHATEMLVRPLYDQDLEIEEDDGSDDIDGSDDTFHET